MPLFAGSISASPRKSGRLRKAGQLLAIAVRRACISSKRQHTKQGGGDCNERKVLPKHCVVMPRKGGKLKRCLMLRLPAQHSGS